MPELKFIPNEAREGEGLADAGIETYRADPFPAVARETSQNSRDAHDRKNCPDQPVRIEIEKLVVPSKSLPGIAKFRHVADLCLESAVHRGDDKEKEFFKQAVAVLNAERIGVLRVSDFNTTGLLGPCKEGSPFHSLVKSSGISNKGDATSGGSFGIGKSAVYSASDLQTAFYSTSYLDKFGKRQFLCQGKTKFCSFKEGAKEYRSIGYWGEPDGYLPVEKLDSAPEWLRRDETGTTVCSIAVRESDDWQHEMMASLIMNFFCAIHRGQMEFVVGRDQLNARTVRRYFDEPAIVAAATTKAEDYVFARQMYACLTDHEEVEERLIEIRDAGSFHVRLMIKDGLPKRVGILRNGMYVCDNLTQFGEKFARFPMYRDFVALVEPANDASNAWLRRMENPRHDELSAERLLDPEQRKLARTAGKKLASEIREIIKAAAKAKAQSETDLDELSEFFAQENERKPDEKGDRDLKGHKVRPAPTRPKVRRSKAPTLTDEGNAGGAGNPIGPGDGQGGVGPLGPGVGSGSGGTGNRTTRKPLSLVEPRTLLPDPSDARARTILFTPNATGKALLKFESWGLSDPAILETDPFEILVDCVERQRRSVDVRFVTPYDGPIEISGWILEEQK